MKKSMMRSLVLSAFLALLALPAFAIDLATARTQGLVGEQLSGYIAAIRDGAEVQALVSTVNAQRKQEYQKISTANGQPVDVVAKLAAPKIIQNLPAGSVYQSPDGGWATK